MSRAIPSERLACDQCQAAQPAGRSATDVCVACGGTVRAEARCPWCLAFGPAVRFCRECGAELPPAAHFGAARLLKAGGVDRFAMAERVRALDAGYVADLDRRFEARWGAARAALERLAYLAAYSERGTAMLEQATTRWIDTLPLEGAEPAPAPALHLPPAPREPESLRGPARDAAVDAVRSARADCDDPDLPLAAAVAAVRLCAVDPDALRALAAGGARGPLRDDWALAAARLRLLPACFPRLDTYFDLAVSRWQSEAARAIGDHLTSLCADAVPRVAALAAIGRVALGDRDAAIQSAVEGALATGDAEIRGLAALALARRKSAWPVGVEDALTELASRGPSPFALAAVDRFHAAGACPPAARACLQACLADSDPAIVLEGLARLRHRRDPPTGFADRCTALLAAHRSPAVRLAAAGAIASSTDPTDVALRAVLDLAHTEPDEDLAREALRAAGEHAPGRPWIVAGVFDLLGRRTGGAVTYLESRLSDWARDGLLPLEVLLGGFADPDVERRRRVVRLGRAAARSAPPALLAAALRVFLTDPDSHCRDTSIWVHRDAWRAERDRKGAPLDAAAMTCAMGDVPEFWHHTAALLRSGAARECAVGEHLEWMAQAAADDTLTPLRADAVRATDLVTALVSAAADGEVRTYPRAKFVQLAGRVAGAVPAAIPVLRVALLPLTDESVNYDLRYWTERVLSELPAAGAPGDPPAGG